MARANLRLAAGVGMLATCLLITGPSAVVAIADPGGGSHGNSGSSKGSGGGKGSDDSSREGSDYSDIARDGGRPGGRPSSRVGSGRQAGTSDQRQSSDYSPDPPQSKTPKVTFGDGRTPGVQDDDRGPGWRWHPPVPALPPPPQVITVPLNPPPVIPVHQPSVIRQLAVAPTGGVRDPLWGVAGLLLIPAAGAILGYRQARAAQAASDLGRRA